MFAEATLRQMEAEHEALTTGTNSQMFFGAPGFVCAVPSHRVLCCCRLSDWLAVWFVGSVMGTLSVVNQQSSVCVAVASARHNAKATDR